MRTIHLLVEEDYIETFMESLPKDKITVIEDNFEANKQKLRDELKDIGTGVLSLKNYTDSMKELNAWLKEQER